ncbi:ATP-grasp domain-containing protein [Edwardsiella anguillarum]|uniref:ATP-grasp domain-containing protein n=1 Tax=Edwardsiella TaxID=635 RepID=UPI00045CDCEC|nr:carboxylate--amine ligase [Edwardsiella anguillarum]AKM47699.1 carboxylate--amine ligase [Edwardsiella sp. EA181011]GAJ68674.1 vibrioferrin ligase/carboxylase protein PvsA [Edwardsiella piscicida]RFT01826.1 siderophore biosynthesis protein PvsA [Edwardsiella anguillarum]BET84422.1 ATP-grasp domain-containing protein [Edwardsiella anguillarum]BET87788.1 ATP-grasp domain-containing protein [Edwardsiella anguillarum]
MSRSAPLVIVSHVVNAATTQGFIPAAQRLDLPVLLLTDRAAEHRACLAGPVTVVECDVFNPLAILETLTALGVTPRALFTNSDHLQSACAIAAAALNLPGKPWPICYAAKEKWRMRQRLAQLGLPSLWSRLLLPKTPIDPDWPWPLVLKPSQGVASMNVTRVEDPAQLARARAAFPPGCTLLLEQYLDGALFTLETLGDGERLIAIGGFDVTLGAAPHFIEAQARWPGALSQRWQAQALAQLQRFGVGLGVCHSEFIADAQGPRLVEINYRSIGDGREFLLDRLLPGGWFSPILRLHLGQPLPDVTLPDAAALIHYLIAENSGTLHRPPQPHCPPGVSYRALHQRGDRITQTHSNKDYLGVLYLQAADPMRLQALEERVLPSLTWEIAP